ncbi:MAG: DUF1768 domain-containing protein [Clostridia bacterium]|nr:DUF1768 domain-containing protein [Clostridia bacterium]
MTDATRPRIVVLGGSFNPPTLAHLRLMKAALDGLQAELGFFIPSSHGYVRRKMKRTPFPDEVLPDELRLGMLHSMCREDPRMQVSDVEFASDRGAGHSYETMQALQQQYPAHELYFIFGADKLPGLPRWGTYEAFTRDFRLLIFSRDGFDPDSIFARNEQLAARRDAFVFLPQPAGSEDVSSTAVRSLLRAGKSPDSLMHPGAAALLTAFVHDHPMFDVNRFHRQYEFLSNAFSAPVCWEGLTYLSAEAAFQAAKLTTRQDRLPFTTMPSGKARRPGRLLTPRPDWETYQLQAMEEIVRAKFTQNASLAEQLLATGDAKLINGNKWDETFWGIDLRTGGGENHLGRILMQVREELRTLQGG